MRRERGWSRQHVSQRASGRISQQYIHFIETGKATNIGSDKLLALSTGLQIPVEILQQVLHAGQPPSIPVQGRVAAGALAHAKGEGYGGELLSYQAEAPGRLFAMEVMGDSMSPKLCHGDMILASRAVPGEAILAGHIYVLEKAGKVTCKYLLPDFEAAGCFRVAAERPDLFAEAPLSDQYRILGRVIEVRKTHSLALPVLKSQS